MGWSKWGDLRGSLYRVCISLFMEEYIKSPEHHNCPAANYNHLDYIVNIILNFLLTFWLLFSMLFYQIQIITSAFLLDLLPHKYFPEFLSAVLRLFMEHNGSYVYGISPNRFCFPQKNQNIQNTASLLLLYLFFPPVNSV